MEKDRTHLNKRLTNKVALITGGDSGIGRAVSLAFAREGADIAIAYFDEDNDAVETKQDVENLGQRCLLLKQDISEEMNCLDVVSRTINLFGKLDILINNAGIQYPKDNICDITEAQLLKTFRTNIFAQFFMVKAAMPFLKPGASIINTTSVTAYEGSGFLLDYSSSKGAIVSFTRSLSASLIPKGIRVNGVAPGPVWTPLIPASFKDVDKEGFGNNTPMGRSGKPEEIAGSFLFLASDESTYITGQILHPNGGRIVGG